MRNPARLSATWIALLTLPHLLAAQQETPPLQFWNHTAWVGENGPPVGGPHLLARTPDGYLWVGAMDALLRFDGVTFTVFDSTTSPLFHSTTSGLFEPWLVERDGTLWVSGPDGAVLTYRDGRFEQLIPSSAGAGAMVRVDGAGRHWIITGDSRLHLLEHGHVAPARLPQGVPDSGINTVKADTGQGLWIGTDHQGLWHVVGAHGERIADTSTGRTPMLPLVQTTDGTLWVMGPAQKQLRRLVGRRWLKPGFPWDSAGTNVRTAAEDEHHNTWLATVGHGVIRWHDGLYEQFTRDDGLSDDNAYSVLPDAGGTLWLSTSAGGLDRLRPTPFITLKQIPGLPGYPYRAAEDGSGGLWVQNVGTGRPILLRGGVFDRSTRPVTTTPPGLRAGERAEILGPGVGGGIWLGPLAGGLIRYRDSSLRRWTTRDGLPADRFWSALESRDGSLWLGTVPRGFGRLRNNQYEAVALPGDPDTNPRAMAEDALGHLWVAAADTGLIFELAGDSVVRTFGSRDGLLAPALRLAHVGGDTLWAVTPAGLVRIVGGRLAAPQVPALRSLLQNDPDLVVSGPDLWVISPAGLVRMSLAALNARADGSQADLPIRTYGPADGVVAPRRASITLLSDFRARDGRVWFTTPAGLTVYDPRWDQVDSAAPIPHVDQLHDSGHPISLDIAPEVPPNPDRVTLTFSATARLWPERTRIQYMLQGADRGWVEAAGSRVASYPQLLPGRYTFRVRAWNVDGIPSATEATLAFRVRPAWYQTITFMVGLILLISSATAGAAVAMQRAWSRRSTALLTSQFEATLAERVRIAQELHDTLLQGFMGVSLRLKSVELASPGLPAETAERLAHVQAMADEALREARESVWDLRSPELDHADLADALLIRARGETGDAGAEVKLTVTGSRRRLAREVEVTAFRIGSEAVVNGVKHGGARTITIVIDFGDRTLTLSVRDDGRGFSPSEGEAARQQGHWGLVGMRERARRAGGTCEIGPGPNAGTVVMAVLPCGGKRS